MSAIDTLLKYIASITPAQADEIMNMPPMDGQRLTKEEHIAKIVVMLKDCNDMPMLDLINKLLVRRF